VTKAIMKMKLSARSYQRTHKDKGKNYIQKYKKMAKMQADLRKLRITLKDDHWNNIPLHTLDLLTLLLDLVRLLLFQRRKSCRLFPVCNDIA
jgi:hypothetical protein